MMNEDFEGELAGDNVDPLDRVQDGGDDETRPQWIDNLFHESDKSGDEFEGFHPDWVTDPHRFHPVNVPDCSLDGCLPTPRGVDNWLLLWAHVG